MFAASEDIPDSEICEGLGVLVYKEDRRKAGNDLRKVRDAATKPIDPKLGVPKHFIGQLWGKRRMAMRQERHSSKICTP